MQERGPDAAAAAAGAGAGAGAGDGDGSDGAGGSEAEEEPPDGPDGLPPAKRPRGAYVRHPVWLEYNGVEKDAVCKHCLIHRCNNQVACQ